jgi:hypothetical protein
MWGVPSRWSAQKLPRRSTSIQATSVLPEYASRRCWQRIGRLSAKDLEMLKGFVVPRSPLGAAALTPPPPWHFAGDALAVEFWSDPELSVFTLPRGLELDKKGDGHSIAL